MNPCKYEGENKMLNKKKVSQSDNKVVIGVIGIIISIISVIEVSLSQFRVYLIPTVCF